MAKQMEDETRDFVADGIEKNMVEAALNYEGACKTIKDLMDKRFGAGWHVIIGAGFSFNITR